jgi:hypothetical protein
MGLFNRRESRVEVPDETTADRVRLKGEAISKLRRAQALKRRSSAMAADLTEHGETNHYIERLRAAMGVTS